MAAECEGQKEADLTLVMSANDPKRTITAHTIAAQSACDHSQRSVKCCSSYRCNEYGGCRIVIQRWVLHVTVRRYMGAVERKVRRCQRDFTATVDVRR